MKPELDRNGKRSLVHCLQLLFLTSLGSSCPRLTVVVSFVFPWQLWLLQLLWLPCGCGGCCVAAVSVVAAVAVAAAAARRWATAAVAGAAAAVATTSCGCRGRLKLLKYGSLWFFKSGYL